MKSCFLDLRQSLISIGIERGVKRKDICKWLLKHKEVIMLTNHVDSVGCKFDVFANEKLVLEWYDIHIDAMKKLT